MQDVEILIKRGQRLLNALEHFKTSNIHELNTCKFYIRQNIKNIRNNREPIDKYVRLLEMGCERSESFLTKGVTNGVR